jgi:hypothetical protein
MDKSSKTYLDSLVNGDGRPSCSPQGCDRGDDQRVRGGSDCSRISGLEVEPLGLRAMRESARGEPRSPLPRAASRSESTFHPIQRIA